MLTKLFLQTLLCLSIFSNAFCYNDPKNEASDFIDPSFYRDLRYHYEGHLWRPVLLMHHQDCDCHNHGQYDDCEFLEIPAMDGCCS